MDIIQLLFKSPQRQKVAFLEECSNAVATKAYFSTLLCLSFFFTPKISFSLKSCGYAQAHPDRMNLPVIYFMNVFILGVSFSFVPDETYSMYSKRYVSFPRGNQLF